MEIETILLETELSTQIKKNPAFQRLLPIDVSLVGLGVVWFCLITSCLHNIISVINLINKVHLFLS